MVDAHVCRAESAPDVWQATDNDSLVGTDCSCCGDSPDELKAKQAALPKFSKIVLAPELHRHRGQRGGPVLKSVQCDICGDTDFVRRCRQCGALFKVALPKGENLDCENCDRLACAAGMPGISVSDWETVSPA